MGKGRKPLPAILRAATGTRAETGYGTNSPNPMTGRPIPPNTLNEHGIRHWHQIVDALDQTGILDRVDSAALEGAAQCYGRAVECDILATENGLVAPDGRISGYANLSVKYWNLWRSFCSELGLSPCSRARLKSPNSRPEINEFESFLKQA